uniref:Uncharacterized protein n=1 Tax=Arundo donax TaxID=35708 RepID=A0A0A9GZZ9_ARUDO
MDLTKVLCKLLSIFDKGCCFSLAYCRTLQVVICSSILVRKCPC